MKIPFQTDLWVVGAWQQMLRQQLKSKYLIHWGTEGDVFVCVCETAHALTNHAVNGAEEYGALSGCRGLAEILQHQRAVAEDIDKLTEVEHPHLL